MGAVEQTCHHRGLIEARWLMSIALAVGLLLSWGGGRGATAAPEDGARSPVPVEDTLPVKEDDGAKAADEKADEEKGEGEKGADAEPPKPAWKASAAEGLRVKGLSCLRIHPKARNVMWAYGHGLGPVISTDGGRTWEVRLEGILKKHRPTLRSQVRISMDPTDAKHMYLTIDGQVFRSTDAGGRWSNITSGALAALSWDQFDSAYLSWDVQVDTGKGKHLVVGTRNDGNHNGGLFESADGGDSWVEIAGSAQSDSGLGSDTFLVRLNPSSDKFLTVAGRSAVWWSDSRGRKFDRNDPGGLGIHDIRGLSQFAGKELFLADVRGIWRSKDGGKRWDKRVLRAGDALGVFTDPHNRKRVFAIFADHGVEISEDGRHSKWAPLGGSEDGHRSATIREILVHPRDRKRVYLVSPLTGLHESKDGGKTFAPVEAPGDAKPGTVLPAVAAPMALVAVHPAEGGSSLAIGVEGQVFRSDARGAAWSPRGPLGMLPHGLQADVAPKQWLATGYRLRRSVDDGDTWTTLWPTEKDLKKHNPEERVASVVRGAAGQDKDGKPTPGVLTLLLERSGSLMRSEDDGATWKEIKGPKFPSSETWAAALAVNAANPSHMVIAARTTSEAWRPRDGNGGLYQTWDGGKSWRDFTGVLKPGKKEKGAARKAKAFWNRAAFVAIDPLAGLILYGADRRGLFTHPIVDPKGKEKAETLPQWFNITPPKAGTPTLAAVTRTLTLDKTSSRYVAQLLGPNGLNMVVSISGTKLNALHTGLATAAAANANAAEVRSNFGWTVMAAPDANVHFTSLAADPHGANRFIATEADGPGGIHIYVDPTVKAAQPAKDEPEDKPAPVVAKRTPPEGMRAFTAGQDKTWRVWGVDTGISTGQMLGHENVVWCIGLSPDETHLVTGSEDRTVRFWNAQNAKHVATVKIDGTARGLAFDDDSAFVYVAAGVGNKVVQISVADRTVKEFVGHKGTVLCVAASEDTARVYSGGEDQVVLVWDTAKASVVNSIVVGTPVIALAVASDGSRVYAAGQDGSIAVFDPAGKPVGRIEGLPSPAQALAMAPEGDTIYATTTDGVLAIDVKALKVVHTHAAPDAGALTCVASSSDGVWVMAGDTGGGMWIWQKGARDAYRARAQEHEGAIHGIALTPEETPEAASGDAAGKDAASKDGASKGDADAPKKDAPKEADPKAEAPKGDTPKDEAPKGEAPKADAPKADAPKAADGAKKDAPAK